MMSPLFLQAYKGKCSKGHRLSNKRLTKPFKWLRSLLNDPNTSSPANVEASNLYKENLKEYTKRVRETVEKSWED